MVESKNPAYAARERTAWVILLTAFAVFLILIVSTPLGLSTFLQRARRPLDLLVQANQGTVGVDNALGLREAVFTGDNALAVEPGSTVITNAIDTGLLLVELPDSEIVLARAQVYGNTSLRLVAASTPRFRYSTAVDEIEFEIQSGRVNVTVPGTYDDRDLSVRVRTPYGDVFLGSQPGRYAIEVTNSETQVSVQQGQALLLGANEMTLSVREDERGLLTPAGIPEGPLASERDLLRNGDFDAGFAEWVTLSWNVERADQPAGETEIIMLGGEPALRFGRVGVGHADSSVRQIVDQDLTDFASMRLLVTMRLAGQSLEVCGTLGSECPLTVVIEYQDQNGSTRTWQQGFYATGNIGPDTPDVCQYCPPPLNPHKLVAPDQLVFYDSENLLPQLAQQGIDLRHVDSISLVVAGHSFELEVIDIALMARQ